jgi:hypothetical protein
MSDLEPRIKINVDPSGAQAGAQDAKRSLDSVKKSFDDLKGSMGRLKDDLARIGAQFKDLGKNTGVDDINRLQKGMNDLHNAINTTQKGFSDFSKTFAHGASEEMKKELGGMRQELERFKNEVYKMDKNLDTRTKFNELSGFDKGIDIKLDTMSKFNDLQTSLNHLKEELSLADAQLKKFGKDTEPGKLEEFKKHLSFLEMEFANVSQSALNFGKNLSGEELTQMRDRLLDLVASLKGMDSALSGMGNNLGKVMDEAAAAAKANINWDIPSLSELKYAIGTIKSDLAATGDQFKGLGKDASLEDLQKIKDSLSDIQANYRSTRDSLLDFVKANAELGGSAAETKKMSQELKALEKDLKGIDKEASAMGKNLDKSIKDATNGMSGINAATQKLMGTLKRLYATYLSFRAIRGLFNDIVAHTIKQEQAERQLETTLKSTKYAAGLTSQELKVMAGELGNVTNYGDEAIIKMNAILATFKNIKGDTFKTATTAVLDFASAFDLNLTTAARMVGGALEAPNKGLSTLGRYLRGIPDSQKKLIEGFMRTGDVAKAQNVILEELNSSYGGVAKAMRDTLGGAIQALKNTWIDFLEMDKHSSFKNLRMSIESLNTALKTDAMQKFKEQLGNLAAGSINTVIKGLRFVADNINAIVISLKTLMAIRVSSWILGIITAVESAVKGLTVMGAAMKLIGVLLSPSGFIAITVAGALFLDLKNQMAEAERQSILTADAMEEVSKQFGKADASTIKNELDKVSEELKSLKEEARKTTEEILKLSTAKFISSNGILGGNFGGAIKELQKFDSEFDNYLNQRREKLQAKETALKNQLQVAEGKISPSPYGESSGSGKSATEEAIERMRNQIKYLGKDGAEFLPTLEKMLGKTALLSKDYMAIRDFQKDIATSGFTKIQNEMTYNGITGEQYLPGLKELQKQFKELSPEWIEVQNQIRAIEDKIHDSTLKKFDDRLKSSSTNFDELLADIRAYRKELEKIENKELREAKDSQAKSLEKTVYDKEWSNAAWDFSQGLLKSTDYAKQLRNELAELEKGTEKWRARYAELQDVVSIDVQKKLDLLKEQLDKGTLSDADYTSALVDMIEKYEDLGKVMQLPIDKLKEFKKESESAALTTGKQLSNALKDATKDFEELQGKGILGAVDGLLRAAISGDNFGESLKKLGEDILYTTLRMIILNQIMKMFGFAGGVSGGGASAALSPAWAANNSIVGNHFSGILNSAKGNVFMNGMHLKKYASGGVVSEPTFFPMRHGLGLMGEGRKEEGILPLERMTNGDLGVQARVSGGNQQQKPSVIINIENKSNGQVTARQTDTKWDANANKFIVNAILEDVGRNGPIAQIMKRR